MAFNLCFHSKAELLLEVIKLLAKQAISTISLQDPEEELRQV